MDKAVVESALDDVRPALDADGFDLRLDSLGDSGDVGIVLAARPDACLDCLVPDDMLVQIIETAIRDKEPALRQVTVTKSGFDAVSEH